MSRIPIPIRLALLAAAIGIAGGRYVGGDSTAVVRLPAHLRTLTGDRSDQVSRADQKWAAFAAREQLGRGPVGYVGEFPTAYEAEWNYYLACYALAPRVVVQGRAAERVIIDRPDGPTVVAGTP